MTSTPRAHAPDDGGNDLVLRPALTADLSTTGVDLRRQLALAESRPQHHQQDLKSRAAASGGHDATGDHGRGKPSEGRRPHDRPRRRRPPTYRGARACKRRSEERREYTVLGPRPLVI